MKKKKRKKALNILVSGIIFLLHLIPLSNAEFFSDKIKYSDYKIIFILLFILLTFSAITFLVSIILSILSIISTLVNSKVNKEYRNNIADIIEFKIYKILKLLRLTEIYNIRLYLVLGFIAFMFLVLLSITHFYIDDTGIIVPSALFVGVLLALVIFILPWFSGKFLDLFMKKKNIE